jgi:hypothetical protein
MPLARVSTSLKESALPPASSSAAAVPSCARNRERMVASSMTGLPLGRYVGFSSCASRI